ncbi:MAG TPA: preprotein translocase subunit SecG [Opitutus sp.]|nr:preprotein translocase subunit SecG [Opitutus sp.]
MNIVLGVLTFLLIVVSVFLCLVILMQRAKSDAGMGAALGGGMAESAFGADTSNVLSKATINLTIAFFVLAFLLYLGRIFQRDHASAAGGALPTINAPAATTKPATTAAPAPVTVPAPAAATQTPAQQPADAPTKP